MTYADYKRVYVDRDSAYGANFNRYEVGTKSESEKLRQVNPNYASGEYKWTHNCQRCVVAWEMIQRGYNVTAKPFSPSDSIGSSGIAAWKFNNKFWWLDSEAKVTSKAFFKEEIQKAFEKWGEGARAEVCVQWLKGNSHGFTARFSNGKIIYEDPQAAVELDIDEVIKKCTLVKGKNWFMRVDNRAFTEAIKDAVENVE